MPEDAAARAVLVKCGNLVIATIKPTHSESMAMSELSDQAKPVMYRQLVCCMQIETRMLNDTSSGHVQS